MPMDDDLRILLDGAGMLLSEYERMLAMLIEECEKEASSKEEHIQLFRKKKKDVQVQLVTMAYYIAEQEVPDDPRKG